MTDPPIAPVGEVIEESELTEELLACEDAAKRVATDDSEGVLPCVGVAGAELVLADV